MAEFTPLEKIPFDNDPNRVKGVFNPTIEDFECLYGGKPQTLKSGEKKILPEPLANHIAKHLADKICRMKNLELLQEKFEGLDDNGREKWRINEQNIITRNDLTEVKNALLFDSEVGIAPVVKMPETKFDPMIEKVKIGKRSKKSKQSEE